MSSARLASSSSSSSSPSASSPSSSASSSPMVSPASSASSWDQHGDDNASTDKEPTRIPSGAAPAAEPAAPLVSILRNPKSGTNVAPAGKLTRPTLAIPEVDEPGTGPANTLASISPTATFSALKNAFASVGRRKSSTSLDKEAGKQAAQPLGKTFKREGPPPLDEKGRIQGAPLLDVDPRRERSDSEEDGGSESAVELGSSYSSQASSSSGIASSDSSAPDAISTDSAASLSSSVSSSGSSSALSRGRLPSASSGSRSDAQSSLVRSSSNASSVRSTSTMSSDTRSSNSHAIRFCPLPATGRLKRANSITIGIAARSQMLLSQGSGPVPRIQQQQLQYVWQDGAPQPPQAAQGQSSGVHPSDPRYAGFQHQRAAAWYEAGGELPPDVVDVGAELKKFGRLAWKKMRGEGKKTEAGAAGADAASSSAAGAASGNAVPPPSVGAGPRSPPPPTTPGASNAAAPVSPLSKANGTAGSSWVRAAHSSLPTIEATEDHETEADGMKTPRAGAGASSGLQAMQSLGWGFTQASAGDDSGSGDNAASAPGTPIFSGNGASFGTRSQAVEEEEDGDEERPATPTGPIHRRVSTGAFLGNQSITSGI
ncbi:hypothetical protein OC844_000840 [Tilletia horrida]|nr:hypothetical protein OC844_000840 [Tilletia horrida]